MATGTSAAVTHKKTKQSASGTPKGSRVGPRSTRRQVAARASKDPKPTGSSKGAVSVFKASLRSTPPVELVEMMNVLQERLAAVVKEAVPPKGKSRPEATYLVEVKGTPKDVSQSVEAVTKTLSRLEKDVRRLVKNVDFVPVDGFQPIDHVRGARAAMVRSGELLSTADLENRLEKTRQAISKARLAGNLFAVELNGDFFYPAFFADGNYSYRQLTAVSKLLGDISSEGKLQFFMTPKGSLGDITPLDALKQGMFDEVKLAAEGFAER